jgi:hypothetical protein
VDVVVWRSAASLLAVSIPGKPVVDEIAAHDCAGLVWRERGEILRQTSVGFAGYQTSGLPGSLLYVRGFAAVPNSQTFALKLVVRAVAVGCDECHLPMITFGDQHADFADS